MPPWRAPKRPKPRRPQSSEHEPERGVTMAALADRLWYGRSAGARIGRAALSPLSALFGAAARLRAGAYDRGVARSVASPIPVISIGNVSVGGTGKTPFAAEIARRLLAMGRTPAIVMRGYGADEPLLHEHLTPGVRVVADADRARGIGSATAAGADVAVLDDGFQHRRARRDLDIVLVSVDRWRDGLATLPGGPLREPLSALRRASLIVLTCKAADSTIVANVRSAVERVAPGVPIAVAAFALSELRPAAGDGEPRPIAELEGSSVLAIAGIGDPESFFSQLERAGAVVTRARFADHHAYDTSDAARLSALAVGHKHVVTTGKDAVKLAALWPANAPRLWYVSQAVTMLDGESYIDAALRRALRR